MVSDPISTIAEWTKYSVPSKISYHYNQNRASIENIHHAITDAGSAPIAVFDLNISVDEIIHFLSNHAVSGINLLSIIPGLLKQTPNPASVLAKLAALSSLGYLDSLDYIQVDGGVNFTTVKDLISFGCNELICGSSTIFRFPTDIDPSQRYSIIESNIATLLALISDGQTIQLRVHSPILNLPTITYIGSACLFT